MKNLFQAGRVLLLDMASTLLFLAVYLLTDNLFLAVGLGMVDIIRGAAFQGPAWVKPIFDRLREGPGPASRLRLTEVGVSADFPRTPGRSDRPRTCW